MNSAKIFNMNNFKTPTTPQNHLYIYNRPMIATKTNDIAQAGNQYIQS